METEEDTQSAPQLSEEGIPTSDAIIDHKANIGTNAWLSTCRSILTSGFAKANTALECIQYAPDKVFAKASEAVSNALNTETLEDKRDRVRVFAVEQLIHYAGAARKVYFARLDAGRAKLMNAGSGLSPAETDFKEIRAAEEEYNSATRYKIAPSTSSTMTVVSNG